jgi:hypothetical protein
MLRLRNVWRCCKEIALRRDGFLLNAWRRFHFDFAKAFFIGYVCRSKGK